MASWQRAAECRQPGGAGARSAGGGELAGDGREVAAECAGGGERGRTWRFYFHAAQPDSIFERTRRDTAQRAGGGLDRVSRRLGRAGAAYGAARLDPDRWW